MPFLPLFLSRDLGVTDPGQLAIWSGVAVSGSGFATALVSPLWGRVADRYGRRPMVLRATLVAGVMTIALSLCQNPVQVAISRLLMGLGSGVSSASNALVANQTPKERVAWALGILTSALAIGAALGPFVGGVLASVIPIRVVMLLAGLLILASAVPTWLWVHEAARPAARQAVVSLRAALAASGEGSGRAIRALVAAQTLIQVAYYGAQPLVALRILGLHSAQPALVTGLTFGLAGAATGLAALLYSVPVARAGYRRFAMIAAGLMAVALLGAAIAPSLWLLIVATAVAGLLYGGLNPTISTMLGLESPREVQATIFGWNGSAFSLGAAGGPLMGGFVAAAFGIPLGFGVAVAGALLLAFVLRTWAREPLAAAPAP
jgi:DHA1 family multidrug resistance protein-like MFS transporter